MEWPKQKVWEKLVPIAKFEVAAELVIEARKRRSSDATRMTLNEEAALRHLTEALEKLGYIPVVSTRLDWRRAG
jgi:hypothetical protein